MCLAIQTPRERHLLNDPAINRRPFFGDGYVVRDTKTFGDGVTKLYGPFYTAADDGYVMYQWYHTTQEPISYVDILTDQHLEYPSGFHIFPAVNDARRLAETLGSSGLRVVKVQWKELRTVGYETRNSRIAQAYHYPYKTWYGLALAQTIVAGEIFHDYILSN